MPQKTIDIAHIDEMVSRITNTGVDRSELVLVVNNLPSDTIAIVMTKSDYERSSNGTTTK